jgi:hypothetical protein
MTRFTWGAAIFGGLGLGAILVNGVYGQDTLRAAPPQQNQVVPLDTYAGRADFTGTATEKSAKWSFNTAGSCTILNPIITIRSDGTADFSAQVGSTGGTFPFGDRYGVKLDFFDRNQLNLASWPFFYTDFTLGPRPVQWTRTGLAIPEVQFPFIVFATRQDHC